MEETFDILIDSFIADRVGIATDFLDPSLATHLIANLTALYAQNGLRHAGTGNEAVVSHDKAVRSDKIYWLDRDHNDPHENDFFDLMDRFVAHMNRSCYTGITGYEFHYALYEKGSFYKKHLDQFRNNSSRKYSVILYLNEDWKAADGGELCIHHPNHLQNIAPQNGKIVFFQSSEMEHEVLPAHKARMSITGWLKVD